MSTSIDWRSFLVPGTQVVEHKLSCETAKLLASAAPTDLGQIIDRLAVDNDIDSLKHFIPLVAEIKGSVGFKFTPSKLTPLKFSVAHMLLEGSGNEGFAADWLTAFGVDAKETRRYAETLMDAAFRDDAKFVNIQRFIGLCKFDGEVFIDRSIVCSDEKFPTAFFTTPTHQARAVLAATLAAAFPDELPVSLRDGYETPLAELIVSKYPFNLPILEQVYGTNNERVKEQIQEAMRVELESGTRMNKGQLWEAIPLWGDAATLDQVVQAKFTFYDVHNNERKDAPFLDALEASAGMEYDPTYAFAALLKLGMNVNRQLPPEGRRLIDAAVAGNHSDSFAMLLAHGADPELRSYPGLRQYSALEILDIKQSFDPEVKVQIDRMKDIARNWSAGKAARAAIEELDADVDQKMRVRRP